MAWQRQFGSSFAPIVAPLTVAEEGWEEFSPLAVQSLVAEVSEELVSPVLIADNSQPIELTVSQLQKGWISGVVSSGSIVKASAGSVEKLSLLDAVFSQVQTESIVNSSSSAQGSEIDQDDTVLEYEANDTELEFEFAEECDAAFELWS